MITKYKGKKPQIAKNSFIAPNAVLIGNVVIGEGSSVWFGAVLRGDINSITVGRYSNIQDNTVVHIDSDKPVAIGDYVTVGHSAIIHGCTIGSYCLIGMGATVLDGANIGDGSVVAAGAVVLENQVVPPLSLVAGVPAKVKKTLPEYTKEHLQKHAEIYAKLSENYTTDN